MAPCKLGNKCIILYDCLPTCICSRLRGGFEDLRRFSDISAMLWIGSKGMPISEIVTTRPELEPLTSCSASQKLNHYTTTTPRVSVKRCTMWIPYKRNVLNQSYGKVIIYFDRGNDNCIHLLISHKISAKKLERHYIHFARHCFSDQHGNGESRYGGVVNGRCVLGRSCRGVLPHSASSSAHPGLQEKKKGKTNVRLLQHIFSLLIHYDVLL